MDAAHLIVSTCHNIWSGWLPKLGIPFLVVWFLVNKFQVFKKVHWWETFVEYAGLLVFLLIVSLAFAYGGWIGLGALAFVLAVR